MSNLRPIRPFARDALLAGGAALAVVAGHRLIPPSAPPRAAAAEAEAAFDAALRPEVSAGAPASAEAADEPVQERVYDVRDLLRGSVEYAAIRGEVDGPEGHVPPPEQATMWSGDWSVRDEAGGKLIDLLDRLAVPPAQPNGQDCTAGGRLFIYRTAAGHARVEAVLDALRLAERARPPWKEAR